MAETQVEDQVKETALVDTSKEDAATSEDKTLLGEESKEVKDGEEKKEENKVEEVKKEETAEEKASRETSEKANSVPEKYEIKAPEGMTIDQTAVDAMSPLFKELKLTSVQAQKLVDTYAPIVKSQAEAQQKAAIDLWKKETEGWKQESLKALGSDAKKELGFAAKVINKVGTKYKMEDGKEGNKLRDVLEETRVGNHPEITRLFIQLGKLISEDSFVEPNKTASTKY